MHQEWYYTGREKRRRSAPDHFRPRPENGGDWAYERGSVTIVARPPSGEDRPPTRLVAKYIDIWRRQADGTWKVARAIWNLDEPAD